MSVLFIFWGGAHIPWIDESHAWVSKVKAPYWSGGQSAEAIETDEVGDIHFKQRCTKQRDGHINMSNDCPAYIMISESFKALMTWNIELPWVGISLGW